MKVGERGQVTIPQVIRRRFGIGPHAEIEFRVVNGLITLKKTARASALRKWVGRCGKNLAKLGYSSADQFLEDLRGR
jgi:AbrB family looped-hinge helix DNA binding protein